MVVPPISLRDHQISAGFAQLIDDDAQSDSHQMNFTGIFSTENPREQISLAD